MKLDLFFVTLLGGYLFLTRCNLTRFVAMRQSGYKLLFGSAIAGLVIVTAWYVLLKALSCYFPGSQTAMCIWDSFVPEVLRGSVSLSIVLSLISGAVVPYLLNIIFQKRHGLQRAISHENNPLEILLVQSMYKESPVELVLKESLVFVGLVASFGGVSDQQKHVELTLLARGITDHRGEAAEMKLTDADQSPRVVVSMVDIQRGHLIA